MPTLPVGSLRVHQGEFFLAAEDWRASIGQVVLLAGPNGSGKTTFQEAAFGLRREKVRRVEWGGEPQAALTSTAAHVPTDLGFFPSCRPRHVAAFFRALYPSWSEAGFSRRVEEWKIPMDRPFKALSMGWKRRFYLARGLATGASVLVLDEPLANVDPDMAYDLAEDFQRPAREENLLVWISTNVLEPFWGRFDQADFLRQGELARRISALEAESSTPRALWRGSIHEGRLDALPSQPSNHLGASPRGPPLAGGRGHRPSGGGGRRIGRPPEGPLLFGPAGHSLLHAAGDGFWFLPPRGPRPRAAHLSKILAPGPQVLRRGRAPRFGLSGPGHGSSGRSGPGPFFRGDLGSEVLLFAACFSVRRALLGAALTAAGY